jgi:hypothetical protein
VRYSAAARHRFGLSRSRPMARLQDRHKRPRTRPVRCEWSGVERAGASSHPTNGTSTSLLPHELVELGEQSITVPQVVPTFAHTLREPVAFLLGHCWLSPGPPRAHSALRPAQPVDGAACDVLLDGSLREPNGPAHAYRAQRLLVSVNKLLLYTEVRGDLLSVQQPRRISRSSTGGCPAGEG